MSTTNSSAIDSRAAEAPVESWRDFADQLTDEERACLAAAEQAGESRWILRDQARSAVWGRQYAEVPAPPGAVHASTWDAISSTTLPERYVNGRDWPGRTVSLASAGFQGVDGSLRQCWIHVDVTPSDNTLTAAEARELAARLVEAADFLDEFST
ncbi:hypothetical protein [Mycobacterium sp. 1274756.6]|uniref:hypothetical protein n=1 Tax=Mycobacterium sp. 1274756.6 TaxID=1834076 RepID=UPI0007FDA2AA|nr:hypothetical protein [Mycobacterium sp. 1274756.6]OBJ68611.1 hypothetical protein A5643_01435 [Mycobacterium sp. 1274756.6]